MENASKALIIAGAILLAIVLVSLGVLVINNARSNIDNQNIDQASIEAFNSKFTSYIGNNKSGTDVNNLIDAISASNGAQLKKAEKNPIEVIVNATVAKSQIDSGATTDLHYGYVMNGKTMTKATYKVAVTNDDGSPKEDTDGNPVYEDKTLNGYPTFDNSMKYKVWPEYSTTGYLVKVTIMK